MTHKTDMQAVLLDAMRVIAESADEIKAGCAIDDEWPDAEDKAEYDRRVSVLERVRALAGQSAGVPEGEYKRMFEDAVRSLAAIDEALGIDLDEAGGAAPILEAIAELKYRAALAPVVQSARVPDGWKLVPIEPTPEMVKAGSTSGGLGMDFHEWMGRINLAWRHILAAAPAPVSEPADMPEGCTPADAEMLRAANHALAAEIDRLKRRLRPFAQLASSPLSWAMVEYCIADDPEKKTLQAPQMQRAFNRAVEAFNENTEQQPMPMMDFGESGLVAEMLEALEAVVSVADRATIEFDKARAAIERVRTARNAGASPSREREQVGKACIAPACYHWDGTDHCTCKRYRAIDVLKRVATALPVLRTMLATEGLGGVEVADEMLSDIRALLGEKADASPSRECGEPPAENSGVRNKIAAALHYPDHWDTAAYPTLDDAAWEAIAAAKLTCSERGEREGEA